MTTKTKTKNTATQEFIQVVSKDYTTLIDRKFPSVEAHEAFKKADALFGCDMYVDAIRGLIADGFRVDIRFQRENIHWPTEDNNYKIRILTKPKFPVRYEAPANMKNAPVFEIHFRNGYYHNNAMRAFYNEIGWGLIIMKAKRPSPEEMIAKGFMKSTKTRQITLMEEAHLTKNKGK